MGKVIYDSDYALLTFFKGNKLLELNWKQRAPEQEYKDVFNHAIETGRTNNVDFFLSDIRNSGAVSIGNLQWLKNNVVPKAVEYGVLKVALIINDELFKKIYADSIRESIHKNKILIDFFSLDEEALNWFGVKK